MLRVTVELVRTVESLSPEIPAQLDATFSPTVELLSVSD